MSDTPPILDRLLEASALLKADMARAFEGTGLTVARTHLLWELHRLGPSTQQSLASALEVSARNVSGLVDALESTGFARRQPHLTDRRAFRVSLTPQGEQAMAEMERDHARLTRQLVEGLDEQQVEHLSRGLAHVTGRLRELIDEATRTSGTEQRR